MAELPVPVLPFLEAAALERESQCTPAAVPGRAQRAGALARLDPPGLEAAMMTVVVAPGAQRKQREPGMRRGAQQPETGECGVGPGLHEDLLFEQRIGQRI